MKSRPANMASGDADAATGALAAVAPHVFYRHVLGVDLLGPYNQHLIKRCRWLLPRLWSALRLGGSDALPSSSARPAPLRS